MKLLILDLDGTLWDHYDASRLTPPFKVNRNELVDSYGNKLRLFEGAREFLEWAKDRFLLSIASWNVEELVRPILEEFGIWHYFVFPKIENHPNKADMILRTLKQLQTIGYEINEVIYVDDRTLHLEEVKRAIPEIKFVHMWRDVKNFEELKFYLIERSWGEENGTFDS
ncbi:magnesium-dependent phosphatase-1 [Thermococcus argininiproducens]|uniref:Magnesium-dependent phosphatase-1 n=1 Tax=Thermococcus argininiproducens TaxID=2866384 RepID=A0A9E7MAN6_9EURY|nr:magnesium-dependent phosphatase-1 [Thermococcus argininiproducens]USH00557.1 magnesium-dependent phosphatase-1 [Thermococcus argininiproducens]